MNTSIDNAAIMTANGNMLNTPQPLSNSNNTTTTSSTNGIHTMNTPTPTTPPKKIKYDVASWSSHSASYHPRNITVNKPSDQSSRWSSGSNNQSQYLMLKLDKMSVVRILFITANSFHFHFIISFFIITNLNISYP